MTIDASRQSARALQVYFDVFCEMATLIKWRGKLEAMFGNI
jgi:hypothetical protein